MDKRMWVYNPKPTKVDPFSKERLLKIVDKFTTASERLSKEVKRFQI